jgi:hypothetical protein
MKLNCSPSDMQAAAYPDSSGPSLTAGGPPGMLHAHVTETKIRWPEDKVDAGDTRASECGGANLGYKLALLSKLCANRLEICVSSVVQRSRWMRDDSQTRRVGRDGKFD